MSTNDPNNNNAIVKNQMSKLFPHFKQKSNWDCGLTCLQMVLSYLEIPWDEETLKQQLNTKSVWTIDLMFLLQTYDVSYIYTTAYKGIQSDYQGLVKTLFCLFLIQHLFFFRATTHKNLIKTTKESPNYLKKPKNRNYQSQKGLCQAVN